MEFCSCGSIIINDQCSNKKCDLKGAGKSPTKATRKKKKDPSEDESVPKKRTRKSSKCITYNLNDEKEDSANNDDADLIDVLDEAE